MLDRGVANILGNLDVDVVRRYATWSAEYRGCEAGGVSALLSRRP